MPAAPIDFVSHEVTKDTRPVWNANSGVPALDVLEPDATADAELA